VINLNGIKSREARKKAGDTAESKIKARVLEQLDN
jgi:hypothetical protein